MLHFIIIINVHDYKNIAIVKQTEMIKANSIIFFVSVILL